MDKFYRVYQIARYGRMAEVKVTVFVSVNKEMCERKMADLASRISRTVATFDVEPI